jgi:hypothetical protein
VVETLGTPYHLATKHLIGGKRFSGDSFLIDTSPNVRLEASSVTFVLPTGHWESIRTLVNFAIDVLRKNSLVDYASPTAYTVMSDAALGYLDDIYKDRKGKTPFTLVQLDKETYEFQPRYGGAHRTVDKQATVEDALKRRRVLRFVYRVDSSSVLYTRRVAVTKLHNWDAETRAFSCKVEDISGVHHRTYSLDKASQVFVEDLPTRKLQPQKRVRLSLSHGMLSIETNDYSFWSPLKQFMASTPLS